MQPGWRWQGQSERGNPGKSEGAQGAQATRRQGIESETMAMRETKS
jgi:hypothetical protein